MTQPARETALPPHIRLIQLATAIWPSRVVYIAAKMGLADLLADEPKAARELAQLTGTRATSLQRLLISLTILGVLTEDADHRFELTPVGAALRTGAPGSARAVVLLMARDRPAAREAIRASRTASLPGNTSEPASPPADSASRPSSVLGPTLEFVGGVLSAGEDLLIEGTFDGEVHRQSHDVTIGERGKVKASVRARTITVWGTIEGELRGDEAVYIGSTARIIGNVDAPRVVIEDGATCSGKVNGIAPGPTAAAPEGLKEAALLTRLAGGAGVRARRRLLSTEP